MAVGKSNWNKYADGISPLSPDFPAHADLRAITCANPNMVNPKHASCLYDGEIVWLKGLTSQGGGAVLGGQRIHSLGSGQMLTPTINADANNDTLAVYKDSSRVIAIDHEFRFALGRQGEGQPAQNRTVLMTKGHQWCYRLINFTNAAHYTIGKRLFPAIITNSNLPAYIKARTSRDLVGLVAEQTVAALGDAGINGTEIPYLGTVTQGVDDEGWIQFEYEPGFWKVAGAVNP